MYKQENLVKIMCNRLVYLCFFLFSAMFVSCQNPVSTNQFIVVTKTSTSFLPTQTQASQQIIISPSPLITATPEFSLISTSNLAEGSYIVYSAMEGISDVGSQIYSLFLMDIQGNEYGIFVHDIYESDISSDGKFIIHRRDSEDFSKTELIVYELHSGDEYVLPNGADCAWPSISPDGNWVISTCIDNDIYAISIPEGIKVLIADCDALGGSCTHPLWSPDDNFIAINYLKEFHPGWGWYLLDPKCIQDDLGCVGKWEFAWAGTGIGDWSDDGKYFVFDKGDWTLSIIDLENNKERHIEIPTQFQIHSLAWSPDNTYIVISGVRTDPSRNVIDLLEVDTGELIQLSYGDYKNVEFWISISDSSE